MAKHKITSAQANILNNLSYTAAELRMELKTQKNYIEENLKRVQKGDFAITPSQNTMNVIRLSSRFNAQIEMVSSFWEDDADLGMINELIKLAVTPDPKGISGRRFFEADL